MSSKKLLIRGGTVLSGDDQLGDLIGDILVADGRIEAIGPQLHAEDDQLEVIDATGQIVIPGFVDTHRHTWQSSIRHRNADHAGLDYFAEILDTIGPTYSPDDVYIGTLLGALSAIDSGTTTIFDWAQAQNSPAHSDASIRGLRESGIRAVFGHGRNLADTRSREQQRSTPHTADIRRIQREHFATPSRVTLAMAARGPEATDDATWRADLDLARELGIMSSIHVGMVGLGPVHRAVERMHDAGVLGPDVFFIHGNSTSDRELSYIAESGAGMSIGYVVEALSPGGGALATDRCLAVGLWPSMSGDTETIGTGDMFSQMRIALAEYRLRASEGRLAEGAPGDLSTKDVLRMATQVGARTIGLADMTGVLKPGRAADLAIIDASAVNLAPVGDPTSAVAVAAHPGNVRTVLIDGVVRKRDGQLVDVDLERVIRMASESQRRHPAQHPAPR